MNEKTISAFCLEIITNGKSLNEIMMLETIFDKIYRIFNDKEKFCVCLLSSINKILEESVNEQIKVERSNEKMNLLFKVVCKIFEKRYSILSKKELAKNFIEVILLEYLGFLAQRFETL